MSNIIRRSLSLSLTHTGYNNVDMGSAFCNPIKSWIQEPTQAI